MRHGPTHALFVACLPVVLLATVPTPSRGGEGQPPLPDSRLGVRTAPLLLLSRPDVRDDLGLSSEQALSAERTMTELYVRATALRGQPDGSALAARRAIDEAQRRWLQAQLTPEQQARLAQIDLQWEGPSALLTRPVVAETLGLTTEQRQVLSTAIARRNHLRAQGQVRPQDERQLAEEALATLSAEQRQRWRAMLGPPFAVRLAAAPAEPPR
ncbi:MAG TPA: hypothetical protein VF590_08995 [Isosphaeraceae bacterium]